MLMILVLHGLRRCICGAFAFFGEPKRAQWAAVGKEKKARELCLASAAAVVVVVKRKIHP